MRISVQKNRYLLATRVGSPSTENLVGGLSFLYGRTANSMEEHTENMAESVLKRRIGGDIQYLYGPLLFKFESAYGKNNNDNIFALLSEIDITAPFFQKVIFESQAVFFQEKTENTKTNELSLVLGLTYKITSSITIRGAYFRSLFADKKIKRPDEIYMQFYLYKGV